MKESRMCYLNMLKFVIAVHSGQKPCCSFDKRCSLKGKMLLLINLEYTYGIIDISQIGQ